jgi:hypothetical protein
MDLRRMKNEYKHAFLAYINQWYELDERHRVAVHRQSDIEAAGRAFKTLAVAYSVIRGFGDREGGGAEREERVVSKFRDVAQLVHAVPSLNDGDMAGSVWALANSIGELFPRTVQKGPRKGTQIKTTQLSAATKFLWFAGHDNVRIFDTQAYAALYGKERLGLLTEAVYDAFLGEWQRQYELATKDLDDAIHAFDEPEMFEWTVIPREDYDKVRTILEQPWFRERAFDKHLWIKGARILNEIENARRERALARSKSKA